MSQPFPPSAPSLQALPQFRPQAAPTRLMPTKWAPQSLRQRWKCPASLKVGTWVANSIKLAKLNIRQDGVKHSRGHNALEFILPLPHGPSGPRWKCNSEVKAGSSGHSGIWGGHFFKLPAPAVGFTSFLELILINLYPS